MSQISCPSKFLSWHVYVEGLMVESITRFEWIQRSVFDVGGSSTGSDRETLEETERRRHRNREYMQCRRAAMTAEQRRLERTRDVQVNTST